MKSSYVFEEVPMQEQTILYSSSDYRVLDEYFKKCHTKKVLLVCGNSIKALRVNDYFVDIKERLNMEVVRFSSFEPNPDYASVVEGVEIFHENECDTIVAVGGGSAIDVAKCIKLYSNMDSTKNYLEQKIIQNDVTFFVIPTTAGTGSEATRFAVIYYKGTKQSIVDDSCVPSVVLFDPTVLQSLPLYQKKVTVLDATCHAIEAFWSVNSTDESKEYSRKALELIIENLAKYLVNDDTSYEKMLLASYYAGKAINITQTTAGHAMAYKMTSLYGLPHGHAVALCVSELWTYMIMNIESCRDVRGQQYMESMFAELAKIFGCDKPIEAATKFQSLIGDLQLEVPKAQESDFAVLVNSVNEERLQNNPIQLTKKDIETLYVAILGE